MAMLLIPKEGDLGAMGCAYSRWFNRVQAIETAGDTAEGEITIVINTPAGFSGTFDEAAQVFFAELCEMFGAELIVLYSVSPDAHALSQAKLFAKNQKTGGEIIFVLPEFLASAEHWENIMGAALKSGAGFLFPKCVDKIYNIYRQFNTMPFGDVAPLLMDQPGAMNKVYALQVKTVVNQMRAEIDSALFSD